MARRQRAAAVEGDAHLDVRGCRARSSSARPHRAPGNSARIDIYAYARSARWTPPWQNNDASAVHRSRAVSDRTIRRIEDGRQPGQSVRHGQGHRVGRQADCESGWRAEIARLQRQRARMSMTSTIRRQSVTRVDQAHAEGRSRAITATDAAANDRATRSPSNRGRTITQRKRRALRC